MSLQTFICAAQRLSFLSTADYLCITPSAVSHRIKNLETHLGFPPCPATKFWYCTL
ncbi:MAG: LysR family transcriptional regulator [Saezia sp.]